MIFRLLLLALAGFVVWRLLKTMGVLPPPAPRGQEQFEPMARCARCGTFLPAKTLSSDGRCGACRE
jgi:hypothetical protein